MFKGLTQRAQKILAVLAQEEAKRYNADQLLPEHIVMAVLKDGEGIGYKALKRLNINPQDVIKEMEKELARQPHHVIFGEIPPSPRGKKILEDSADEARILGHQYIGTEHLVLASAREKESIFTRYLAKYKINLNRLRQAVVEEGSAGASDRKDLFSTGRRVQPEQKRSTPTLDEFSRDLTAFAQEGRLDPVIGREKEIHRVIQILARRTKNNPVLIGEPGVGKTAIVEGLSQRIVDGSAPEVLQGKRVVTLDLASLIAGTKYRGEFEERLKRVMKEIMGAKDIILFIDELHTIIGAGGAEGAIDASNMLKPALSRGELQCIGATTLNEYKKYIEKDAALERRFQSIFVEEPGIEESIEILEGIKTNYEEHHHVIYTPQAIEVAVRLSSRYITDKYLPDKAIDLVDEAGSQKRIMYSVKPKQISELERDIENLTKEKITLVNTQNYEKAAEIRDAVHRLKKHVEDVKANWRSSLKVQRISVTDEDIYAVISSITGIPLSRIAQSESEKLLEIEKELHKTVIGQDDAISVIASAIRRSRTGLSSPGRPLGSFIFLGPTGVGKTLLAKTLSEFLFGNSEALIRIDMSDYMEKHNVSRLVGAPPGYVGYEEGGILTEKIRRRPYSVILLDEIEKAHPDVFNLLLQVLEEGELHDNLGHKISFRNTVLIMTSNVGTQQISRDTNLGFTLQQGGILDYSEIKSSALNELKKKFQPEFINRVDEIVVFHGLGEQELRKILEIMLNEVRERLSAMRITLTVNRKVKDFLIESGTEAKYGARPLRRTIHKEIEDPLSVEILKGRFEKEDEIVVDMKGSRIVFKKKKKKVPLLS